MPKNLGGTVSLTLILALLRLETVRLGGARVSSLLGQDTCTVSSPRRRTCVLEADRGILLGTMHGMRGEQVSVPSPAPRRVGLGSGEWPRE